MATRYIHSDVNVDGTLLASEVRTQNATELVLNAGESHSYATSQGGELVYVNAESGLQINSSPDNWGSGWAGRWTATICGTAGTSVFPASVTAPTFIGDLTGNADTATSAGRWTTARTLTIGGTGKAVDGSGNVSWSLGEIGAQAAGTYNTIIGTDSDINTSGATIIDQLNMTDGVIQSHSTRVLTLADLGYTGATNANNYVHPSYNGDDFSVDTGALTGATVVSDIDINVTTDASGHVTDANGTVATRTLTLANLGYTGATNANNYVHPTHPGDDINIDTGALTGATVISDLDFNVTTDTLGHVTDANAVVATRNLTASNIGALATSGGTMTGNITFSDTEEGIKWSMNTDGAEIYFKNDADADSNSYLAVHMEDNGNEYFKIKGRNATVYEDWMDVKNGTVRVNGDIYVNASQSGDESLGTNVLTGGNVVYHSGNIPTYNTIIGTDSDINTSGATVVDQLNMTDGVIQSHSTRTMTLADLGYTGATNANNYVHPTHPGDDFSVDTGALTGATVVSDIDINVTTDTAGHVTDANGTVATRTLTLADLGYTGATNANNYSLPQATSTTRGGVELFSDTDQSVAANAVSATAGRTYGIQLNSSNQMVVNVPWSDTNTNTTNFNVQANGGTQVNISAGEEINFVNGNATTAVVVNQTNPTVTFNHNDTSSQASVNNSGNTVIQDITLDTYGHITGITSATISSVTSATTATNANFVDIDNDDTGDTNCPIVFTQTSTTGFKKLYEDSGVYINNTANTIHAADFSGTSDFRKKEDIKEYEPKALSTDYKTFKFKDHKVKHQRFGVIAQELEVEHPEFVRTDKEGIKSVSYQDLHSAEIAYLKKENEELKARLEKLEKYLLK